MTRFGPGQRSPYHYHKCANCGDLCRVPYPDGELWKGKLSFKFAMLLYSVLRKEESSDVLFPNGLCGRCRKVLSLDFMKDKKLIRLRSSAY